MPLYRYKALDSGNNLIENDIKAGSLDEAKQTVIEKGLTPIRVELNKKLSDIKFDVFKNIGINDVIYFCRELAIIIKSGISLTTGLEILKKQSVKGLKQAVMKVELEVQKGRTLAQAMRDVEPKFPDLLVKMISTGEASGNLDNVLDNMAEYYERENQIRLKITSAMVYPLILVAVAITLLVGFAKIILPLLMDAFEGQKLHPVTEFMLNFMKLAVSWYSLAFFGAVIVLIILAKVLIPDKKFSEVKDSIILKMPIVGPVVKSMITIRFISTLYLLLRSGLDIVNILEVIKKIMANSIAENAIEFTLDGVLRGEKLGTMLTVNKFFDPLIVQMISIGEETGELEKILHAISGFYEKRLQLKIERLISLIEPAIIIVIGVVAAFIVVSIALSIGNMLGGFTMPGGSGGLE